MLFFLCSSNQKVINRYVLYVKHTLITQSFLDYSIDKKRHHKSKSDEDVTTKMHQCRG